MNSIAAPSQEYVKTRQALESKRQQLIDAAYAAHRRDDLETALELFDDAVKLDSQLVPA